MSYIITNLQARCAALGFWPGPIDGRMGPRTRAAESAARAFQEARGLPLFHPSGITRVHWHWTGGTHKANSTDKKAYHILFEGHGAVIRAHPLGTPLAHTQNANTGAVGLSCCAMAGAIERPFNAGAYPITSLQLHAMTLETAIICKEYDIPVSPWSTLSHVEVQSNLGIPQRRKWDITYLPGMEITGDPLAVGNDLRAMTLTQMKTL